MKKLGVVFLIYTISTSCVSKSHEPGAANKPVNTEAHLSTEELWYSVSQFVDQWHRDAANADTAYFEKMAPLGAYLGTDPTENWTTSEFREWSRKYFEEGEAWDFQPRDRTIYLSEDGKYVWFDELLDTWMGVCRGSGVLSAKGNSWQIEHYHLSMTIPNDLTIKVIEMIEREQKLSEKQGDTL